MTDRDTITLPREVAQLALDALHYAARPPSGDGLYAKEIAILRTALAAEQPKQKHPGYIIGSHWLETAYSRICAGESEARVLRDYGSVSVGEAEALQRENEALRRDAERYRWLRTRACHGPHERFVSEYGWFDVSGQHEPGFDAAIDAAMENKR